MEKLLKIVLGILIVYFVAVFMTSCVNGFLNSTSKDEAIMTIGDYKVVFADVDEKDEIFTIEIETKNGDKSTVQHDLTELLYIVCHSDISKKYDCSTGETMYMSMIEELATQTIRLIELENEEALIY